MRKCICRTSAADEDGCAQRRSLPQVLAVTAPRASEHSDAALSLQGAVTSSLARTFAVSSGEKRASKRGRRGRRKLRGEIYGLRGERGACRGVEELREAYREITE